MSFGFTSVAPNPDEYNLYFSKSLKDNLPAPILPLGYTIRPLNDIGEFEKYQSLHGFAQVNPGHLGEQFASDEYRHLIVIHPNGDFAAYCECSICRAEWRSSCQRIGWIDYIETRPEYQKQGLAWAILFTALAQLRTWGVDTAMLVTINTNLPAVSLYEKTGFERADIAEAQRYEKQIQVDNVIT